MADADRLKRRETMSLQPEDADMIRRIMSLTTGSISTELYECMHDVACAIDNHFETPLGGPE
tara:strand:+ start:1073 stop:1258 length:186 start_codon:yes stop_codon:yes gene_type:complete